MVVNFGCTVKQVLCTSGFTYERLKDIFPPNNLFFFCLIRNAHNKLENAAEFR